MDHLTKQALPFLSWTLPGDVERHAVLLQCAVARAAELCHSFVKHCQQLMHILAVVCSRGIVAKAWNSVAHLQQSQPSTNCSTMCCLHVKGHVSHAVPTSSVTRSFRPPTAHTMGTAPYRAAACATRPHGSNRDGTSTKSDAAMIQCASSSAKWHYGSQW